jgi:regulator of protease activity HflC (stomatin/prohibitin superfamily)
MEKNVNFRNIMYGLAGTGVLLVGLFVYSGIRIIETGNVGVKSTLGTINPEELEPGLNFAIPIISKIEPIFTKTIMINYSGNDKKIDTEELYTERSLAGEDRTGLEMAIDLIVEVSPQPKQMADMYIDVGRQGFAKKVLQPIRGGSRKVLGQYNAETIMSLRKEVEKDLKKELNDIFSENPYYKLENVQLKKIYLPKKVKDAIERVQLAKQEAKATTEQIKKNTALAQSKVELAKGEAQALRTTSKGKADAIIIEAKAQSEANGIIAKSLTPILLKQNHIEAWRHGGAKVPKFMSGGNSGGEMFLINTKE